MEQEAATSAFLDKGEMAKLTTAFNWSKTSLGAIDKWPVSLRTAVNMILSSRFPMLIFWGEELITFYNDAFRPSLGIEGKHPFLLGRPGKESWAEVWPVVGPMIEDILAGGPAVQFEDQKLPIYRDGKLDPAYWTYCYSPLTDDAGNVNGILVTCNETTEKVLNLERLSENETRLRFALNAGNLGSWELDLSTVTLYASTKCKANFGYRADEAFSYDTLIASIHPDDLARQQIAVAEVIELRKDLDIEYRAIWPDGSVHWVNVRGQLRTDSDGHPVSIVGTSSNITDRKNAEQALRESEARFRTFIEQAPIATSVYTGPDLIIEIANEPMLKFWGKPDAVGKPLLEALPELVDQPFPKLLHEIYRTGIPYHGKSTPADLVIDGKLSTFYFDFTYQPIFNETGDVTGIINMALDVTEQVLVNQRVQKAQADMLASFEESPVAIATVAAENFTFRAVNKFYAELVGRTRDELIGIPLFEALPELVGQGFEDLLQNVVDTGEVFIAREVPVILKKNDVLENFYMDLNYRALHEGDKIVGILIVATNVTEQVMSRKIIEERETELLNAIEVAGLARWKMDVKENTFFYSERFMDWLGFTENTKDLEGAYNSLPGEYRESVPAALAEVLKPGSDGFYENVHPIVNRVTGQTRIIHAQGQVFYDNLGLPETLSGTAQDVTLQREMQLALKSEVKMRTEELDAAINKLQDANEELEQSNLQLRQSNAELAQFAYIASHDLQEPLRKISTFSQLLESSIGENINAKTSSYIEKIRNSSLRMTNLIRDVLQYSQLATQQQSFVKVDLNQAIVEIVADYDLLIEQKHGKVIAGEMPEIEAIPLQMNQLFANLIGNALKFSKEGIAPVIKISATDATDTDIRQSNLAPHLDYVKITVIDNGIGFKPEYAEQIFNIFQRLHSKSEYEGTGIGLALCKKIVNNHHGDIHALSGGDGGATFIILLPRQH